jgi:Flp pilus assembly protein TadG
MRRPIATRRRSLLMRREEGAAAVEFALISIVLFVVLFGIIQYGLWLSQYEVYQGAAREGARLAAVRCGNTTGCLNPGGQPSLNAVGNRVTQAASPYTITGPFTYELSTDGTSWSATTTGCDGGASIGKLFRVSWTQQFTNSFIGLIPSLDNKLIKGVFRCE